MNILSNCNFDVYLSISNNLNVTENVINTSEGDLPISNNVSLTEKLICIIYKRDCPEWLNINTEPKPIRAIDLKLWG